ncbi:MAG: hypothetical protein KGL69_01405 [Alphaproteobacteria bacterium]|nr:hypothetical protein [Alphaproteobacteria bacterium]
MDIHKPKAAHSWREFLTEIGTIICGILIALALEQALEAVHEHKIAEDARASIRSEVRENLYWMDIAASRQGCVRRRLTELTDLLAKAADGRPFPPPQHLGLLPHMKLTNERWQANGQGGRTSLFAADDQRLLGNMYFTTADLKAAQAAREEAWAKLMAIQGVDRLSPAAVQDFRVLLAQVRYQNYMVVLSIKRAHQWAARLHIQAPDPMSGPRVFAGEYSELCRSMFAKRDLSAFSRDPDMIGTPDDLP